MAGRAKAGKLLSDRLLRALTQEMTALEAARPAKRKRGAEGETEADGASRPADTKARIEAIGHLTRSLEKLLELRQIETLGLTAQAEGDDATTERLREEMLKRLRALDARRPAGSGLFDGFDARDAGA